MIEGKVNTVPIVRTGAIFIILLVFVLSASSCGDSLNKNVNETSTNSGAFSSPMPRVLATPSQTPLSFTPEPLLVSETAVSSEPTTDTIPLATIDANELTFSAEGLQFELLPCLPTSAAQNHTLSLQRQPLTDGLEQIIGLSYPVESLHVSPDGRWLVVTLKLGVQNQAVLLATWMIDTVQEQHLQLNDNQSGRSHFMDWFSESELLWVTQDGDIAVGNGAEFRELATPVEMAEVWYLSDGYGLARDVNDLWWRYHVEKDRWEIIDTVDSEPLQGFGAVGVSQDSTQALLFQPSNIWILPLSDEDEATKIGGNDVSLVGSDAVFMPSITQLEDGANWFIGASIWYPSGSQEPYPLEGFVFSAAAGRVLENSDFGIPESYKIVGFTASPDGRWLAISLNKSLQETNVRPTIVYLTQTSQPKSGAFFQDVKIVHLGTDYAVFEDDGNALLGLHLTSGNAIILDNAKFLNLFRNILVIQESSNRVLIVDLSDNSIHGLDMPNGYSPSLTFVSSNGTVYLSLVNGQSESCQSALLEYHLK